MKDALRNHICSLKSTLLSMSATGVDGFEGLIGATLCGISGVPFRLAGSGSQFGIDGKATYSADPIGFEGKRYDGDIPRTEVISKLGDIAINDNHIDLWVLGATTQVKEQLASDARKLGRMNGTAVVILDWSETDLPPFAVAMSLGGEHVQEFLKKNISDPNSLQKALGALEAIKDAQNFSLHAERIKEECNAASMGMALARKENTKWLSDVFSSKKRAKTELGQPLCPDDKGTVSLQQRQNLLNELCPYFTSAPDEKVLCVLGEEGNGKSWIIAQSWLSLENKPLMLFLSPDDFKEVAGQNDFSELLIKKLIKQTGDRASDDTVKRWQRRLQQWEKVPQTDELRLIVAIDGINQRPNVEWARIIEGMEYVLSKIGGRLLITSRTTYFKNYIKKALSTNIREISVPEWAIAERDEILKTHDIKPSELHADVARSLLNPRLLGIAVTLLNKDSISDFEELSVSRLLFEHIQASERDSSVAQPALKFAERLQEHAKEILKRVQENQQGDRQIFKDADVAAVADGRFYHAVKGDPTRVSLQDDGLTLALGLAVIDRLRIAKRNGRNLDNELDIILEPITALDDTANVLLAALTVVVLDENDFVEPLAKGFSSLQNLDETKFPSFVGLVKICPKEFMDAAHALCLSGIYHQSFSWIRFSLIAAGKNSSVWMDMADKVRCWLSRYSLSVSESRSQQEEVGEKINENLEALSNYEESILENLKEEDGDLSSLSEFALLLLAHKNLAPFAEEFVNWSFANALNPYSNHPYKDFWHLIRFNQIDWQETREALLSASEMLRNDNVSRTGKWALVNILRATGSSEDAKEMLLLVEDLTKDRKKIEPWRLIEDYCKSDPCDPESEKPANISETALKYENIDVSQIRTHRGQTAEDYFFSEARLGLARFSPEVAIKKHRAFTQDILVRKGHSLEQGLFELRKHNALLTTNDAHAFIKKREEVKATQAQEGLSDRDAWIISQYCLLLAFPFISAPEQMEALLSDTDDENILLDITALAKELKPAEFEEFLQAACDENDELKQYLLLGLANSTLVEVSSSACSNIQDLLRSESERVRAHALGVAAHRDNTELLRAVVESNWSAENVKDSDAYEVWYGSISLLKAAEHNLIGHKDALDRISPRLYGKAAVMLNDDTVEEIARRLDICIHHAYGLQDDLVAPSIELEVPPEGTYEPSLFSISDSPSNNDDPEQFFKRISESREDFQQRQKHNYDAFCEFKDTITKAKALIILDNFGLEEFEAVVSSNKSWAQKWYSLFVQIDKKKLPAVHNLALMLAYVIGQTDPEKAGLLFQKVKKSQPFVRFSYGKAGVKLDEMACWAGEKKPVLNELRFARLDGAKTDHDLFVEVLAALYNDQQELLTIYIEDKISQEHPAEIARGIMVAGFSDQSEFNDKIIEQYEDSAGLLGSAQKAAKFAYERNIWARHWFEQMCEAENNIDFWRYAVLFAKIVDGRFEVWRKDYTSPRGAFSLFAESIKNLIGNRHQKWQDKRKTKFFGDDAPTPLFLENIN